MLPPRCDDHLEEAAAEVLEGACFLSIEGETEEPGEAPHDWISRSLHFTGPLDGSFGLRAPLSTAHLLACNLLGQDAAEVSDAQAAETMGEIANMICGATLGRLEESRAFDLTAPHDDATPAETVAVAGEHRCCRTLLTDGGLLTVWIAFAEKQ